MYRNRSVRFSFTSILLGLLSVPAGSWAATYSFQTINNNTDPAFNQLLGINTQNTIVGYYGDGAVVPNNGYVVVPPYGQANFTLTNFPGTTAVQTQVTGINSNINPTIVGFWADAAGDNFGWSRIGTGGPFTTLATPAGQTGNVNQLLGVNNSNTGVGFYTDSMGNAHGYTVNLAGSPVFTNIVPPGSTSTTAAGINNAGVVAGFFTDASGTHGFVDIGGTFTIYNDPNAGMGAATMFLGINNNGFVVGNYVDAMDNTHGLLFDYLTNTWMTIDDPGTSQTPAFGVAGTIVNGLNDANDLVGFFSDGTNVNGFLATPTAVPEPASLGLIGLAALALGFAGRKKLRRP